VSFLVYMTTPSVHVVRQSSQGTFEPVGGPEPQPVDSSLNPVLLGSAVFLGILNGIVLDNVLDWDSLDIAYPKIVTIKWVYSITLGGSAAISGMRRNFLLISGHILFVIFLHVRNVYILTSSFICMSISVPFLLL
jgi:hypothetical protein